MTFSSPAPQKKSQTKSYIEFSDFMRIPDLGVSFLLAASGCWNSKNMANLLFFLQPHAASFFQLLAPYNFREQLVFSKCIFHVYKNCLMDRNLDGTPPQDNLQREVRQRDTVTKSEMGKAKKRPKMRPHNIITRPYLTNQGQKWKSRVTLSHVDRF